MTRIRVTRADLARAERLTYRKDGTRRLSSYANYCRNCPLAVAIRRAGFREVFVGVRIRTSRGDTTIPPAVDRFKNRWDTAGSRQARLRLPLPKPFEVNL